MSSYAHTRSSGPTSPASKRERLMSEAEMIGRIATGKNGVSLPRVRTEEEALKRVDEAMKGGKDMNMPLSREEQQRRIDRATAADLGVTASPATRGTKPAVQVVEAPPAPNKPLIGDFEIARARARQACPIGTPMVVLPHDQIRAMPDGTLLIDLEALIALIDAGEQG